MKNPDASPRHAAPITGLEAEYFTDPDLYRRIRDQVFFKHWLLACHCSEVEKPGDFLTLSLFDQDLVILRDSEGSLRALYNVCQHRGHQLVSGKGNKSCLVCPYHRWTYGLDGRLRGAPHSHKVSGFNTAAIRIPAIRIEEYLGFVFINFDPDCEDMVRQYPGVREQILALCPDIEQRHIAHQFSVDEGCNWLIAVENYNECYHCSTCHPAFARGIIEPSSYRISRIGAARALRHSSRASSSEGAWYDVSGSDYGSFFFWPASSIQIYPGGVVNSFSWRPLAVDDVRVFRTWYSASGEVSAELQKVIDNDSETTFREDLQIVRQVQRGVRSRGYRPGPLVIDPAGGINNEEPIRLLHQWLKEAVG